MPMWADDYSGELRVEEMKMSKLVRGTVVALTCFGLLNAQLVCAAGPAIAKAAVRDVALQSPGVLHGQLVNAQGAPQAGAEVAAVQEGNAVAVARTDQAGRFMLANLSGGVYELRTQTASGVYRLWAPRTAPPAAQDGVLMVSGENVVRGFGGQNGGLGFLANPLVLAGIVAAAIAIPLAIANDDDDAS